MGHPWSNLTYDGMQTLSLQGICGDRYQPWVSISISAGSA
jgi:hypothetical protein